MLTATPSYAEAGRLSARPSRVIAAILSLAIMALFLLALLRMGLIDFDSGRSGKTAHLTTVDIGAAAEQHVQKAVAAQKQQTNTHETHQQQQHVTPPVPQTAPPVAPTFIHLSHDEFAAADISRFPKNQASSESAQSSASTYGPGEGPGGVHLYNAAWYREPSDAELGPYLKQGAPEGSWATIACRTVEHFHVEDCRELDESPPGSGLARSLRLASWQFLVRPPRVNGDSQVGTWVRIRFTFSSRAHGG